MAAGSAGAGVTIDDARELASTLERSYEVLVHGRVKFRVGRIVYLAFSKDETLMGFAFPKDERDALIASAPDRFLLPRPSDLRYQWAVARLARLDLDELHELVVDAWSMVVPKVVARRRLGDLADRPIVRAAIEEPVSRARPGPRRPSPRRAGRSSAARSTCRCRPSPARDAPSAPRGVPGRTRRP